MRIPALAAMFGIGLVVCAMGPAGAAPASHRPDAWKQLDQVVDLSDLRLNTTLRQAIEIIRDSTKPRLNIVVLWRDITANTLVTENSEIAMEGVDGITAGAGLDLVLRAVAAGPFELGYSVHGGVVVIGTSGNLPAPMYTRVYDISDLVAPPSYAQPGLGGFGGFGRLGLGLGGMFGNQGAGGGYGGYGNVGGGYGNSGGYGGYGNSFGGSSYGGYPSRGSFSGGYSARTAAPGRSQITGPRDRNTTRAYAHVRRPSDTRVARSPAGSRQDERRFPGPYNAGEELAALIMISTMPRSGR